MVPARAGSKRIPDKNVRPLLGRPLLTYPIAAAIEAGCFEAVAVSSDSQQYLDVGEAAGAVPVMRPPELATDDAGLVETALHAVECALPGATSVCIMMPTSPLVSAGTVQRHVDAFVTNRRSFQLSTIEYFSGHAEWGLRELANGQIEQALGSEFFTRSQELEGWVCPTGAVWLARVEALRAQGTFYGRPLYGERTPYPDGIDINDEWEFEMAEALALGYAEIARRRA